MRNTDERLSAALLRAEELERQDRRRGRRLAMASVAACLALIAALALAMPGWNARMAAWSASAPSMTASLFSGSGAAGYLVIGILAFLLGAAVTVLCFRLGKRAGDTESAP